MAVQLAVLHGDGHVGGDGGGLGGHAVACDDGHPVQAHQWSNAVPVNKLADPCSLCFVTDLKFILLRPGFPLGTLSLGARSVSLL